MRMLLIPALVLLLALALTAAPAPENPPAKPKEELTPVEIDFAPLPDDGTAYRFRIIVEPEIGNTYDEICSGTLPGSDVRGLVRESLESVGWKVQPVGSTKLIVESCRGKLVKKLEIKPEGGLQKENVPIVKRLPPPKKDK